MNKERQSPPRAGFSMFESIVAVSVAAVAGAALLSSLSAAVRSSSDAALTAQAYGLAEQLMDEIASVRFPSESNTPPLGVTRENFDDIDDYAGWSASPPQSRLGAVIGTEGATVGSVVYNRETALQPSGSALANFTHEVVVERIEPDGGTGWTVVPEHTNYRRVTVRVNYVDGQMNSSTLASITRIYSYAPIAP